MQSAKNAEVMVVANKIKACNQRLEGSEKALEKAVAARSVAIAHYDRDLGLCIAKFRCGETVMVEDKPIKDPPATTTRDLAKSAVWKSRLKLEQAEGHYKVVISKIDSIRAMLVGWQSIYKRLDNV
jgi:hypothetical protein